MVKEKDLQMLQQQVYESRRRTCMDVVPLHKYHQLVSSYINSLS
jgi:hypothetical protein